MKNLLFTAAIVIGCCFANLTASAQTKIGGVPGAADASAYLQLGDASGANKGLLLSRVNLTATNVWGLAGATSVAGMVVYNTNSGITGPNADGVGLYYWDGTIWVRVKGNNSSVFIYGKGTPIGTVTCDPSTNVNTLYTDTLFTSPTYGQQWVCDGTSWKISTAPAATEWYINNTTNDAGGDKTSAIWRKGSVGISDYLPTFRLDANYAGIHIKSKALNDVIFEGIDDHSAIHFRKGHANGSNMVTGELMGELGFTGTIGGVYPTFPSMIEVKYQGNGTNFLSDMNFFTSTIPRMYITSNGDVTIGDAVWAKLSVGGTIASSGYRCRNGISGGYGLNFFNILWTGTQAQLIIDDTNMGAIQLSSDRRLKETINPLSGDALSRVMQLRPVSFKYKNIPNSIFTGSDVVNEGFIADELQTVIPSAVNGEKDALTSDGKIQPQTLNLAPIVSVLTKALQEQQALIEKLEKRIEVLEAK